jgi:hypothetical protein
VLCSFIHLSFRLELPASLSLLKERGRLSRLFDLSRFSRFLFDLSRSFARLRRTGETDLLLERPIEDLTRALFVKSEIRNVCSFKSFSC